MLDDSAAMMDAANPTLMSVVGDNEEKCDTCKLIVTQVATMLRNPVRNKLSGALSDVCFFVQICDYCIHLGCGSGAKDVPVRMSNFMPGQQPRCSSLAVMAVYSIATSVHGPRFLLLCYRTGRHCTL